MRLIHNRKDTHIPTYTNADALQTEYGNIALALTNQLGTIGHINNRCRLSTAPAAINNQINSMFKTVSDFVWIGQWLIIFGQHEGAT